MRPHLIDGAYRFMLAHARTRLFDRVKHRATLGEPRNFDRSYALKSGVRRHLFSLLKLCLPVEILLLSLKRTKNRFVVKQIAIKKTCQQSRDKQCSRRCSPFHRAPKLDAKSMACRFARLHTLRRLLVYIFSV